MNNYVAKILTTPCGWNFYQKTDKLKKKNLNNIACPEMPSFQFKIFETDSKAKSV